jgi:hypothetical protein
MLPEYLQIFLSLASSYAEENRRRQCMFFLFPILLAKSVPMQNSCAGSAPTSRRSILNDDSPNTEDGDHGNGSGIVASAPELLDAHAQSYEVGVPILPLDLVNRGEPVVTCVVTPFLPTGLSISVYEGSCRVTGTPAVSQSVTTYKITGSSKGGESTAKIVITITAGGDEPVSGGANKIIHLTESPNVNSAGYVFTVSDFLSEDPDVSLASVLYAIRVATLPSTGQIHLDEVPLLADEVVSESEIVDGKLLFYPSMNIFGATASSFTFHVIDESQNEDPTPYSVTFNITSTDTTGPRVTGVFVNSTAWDPVFRDFADGGFGSFARGYAIPTGSANQLLTLPWVNINQILVRFNEDVEASLSISDFSLGNSVAGIRANETTATIPEVVSLSFDTATLIATLTLNQFIDASVIKLEITASNVSDISGNILDGEWVNGSSTLSGNGVNGGNFSFQLNVLPGKASQVIPTGDYSNAIVEFAADGSAIVAAQAGFIEEGYFEAPYSIYADINGSADSVDSADLLLMNNRIGSRLLHP